MHEIKWKTYPISPKEGWVRWSVGEENHDARKHHENKEDISNDGHFLSISN